MDGLKCFVVCERPGDALLWAGVNELKHDEWKRVTCLDDLQGELRRLGGTKFSMERLPPTVMLDHHTRIRSDVAAYALSMKAFAGYRVIWCGVLEMVDLE